MISVPVAILTIVGLAGLGAIVALTRLRKPLLAIPAAAAMVLALTMFFLNPQMAQPEQEPPVIDISDKAPFATLYQQNKALWGKPVAPASVEDGILSQIFTYVVIQSRPDVQDPNWRIQTVNTGAEIMRHRGIQPNPNPTVPRVVSEYLAGELARGVDILKIYGKPLTNPVREGDSFLMYWDKTILNWPGQLDAPDDPASVKRLPVGTIYWNIITQPPGWDNPWTPMRRVLGIIAAILAAMPLLAMLIPGLRADGAAFD